MRKNAFIPGGSFFKGNTHTHTNVSDGRLSSEQIISAYKTMGYNFLAITDHGVYSDYRDYDDEKFIMLPGVEIGMSAENGKHLHVVGLGKPGENKFLHLKRFGEESDAFTCLQDIVDLLAKNGNYAVIAHPSWSRLEFSDIANADNIFGMEIYNHLCEKGYASGEAGAYYEWLCSRGKAPYCFSVDDNHADEGMIGGFIMVKAEKLDAISLYDAMGAGSFYASYGPLIYDFYLEDDVAHISCSPVERINLVTNEIYTVQSISDSDGGLTDAGFKLGFRPSTKLVRVIITDSRGRKAYSQPIKI